MSLKLKSILIYFKTEIWINKMIFTVITYLSLKILFPYRGKDIKNYLLWCQIYQVCHWRWVDELQFKKMAQNFKKINLDLGHKDKEHFFFFHYRVSESFTVTGKYSTVCLPHQEHISHHQNHTKVRCVFPQSPGQQLLLAHDLHSVNWMCLQIT